MGNNPIRVLHVIGIMNRGGAENMIMNLYRGIDRTKIQFDFVEHTSDHAAFDDEILSMGGHIYYCPRYNGKNHFSYIRWWKNFFQDHAKEYPIIHGHIGSTAAIYLSIAKKYGLYTIAHSHSAGAGSVIFRCFSYPTRFVADHFFACSYDAGTSRYGNKVGQNPQLCQTLNNAIDTDKFIFNADIRKDYREQLKIHPDTLVVGHTGRFVDAKNHSFLLDVFAVVHKHKPDSVLLLVGDGELRPQIEDKIQQLHLEDAVIFTGVRNNVYDYYQVMDVFVMPSLYEGFPVTLVEAQAAGLPCLISDTIPDEVTLTDLIHFASLKSSPEIWAESIDRLSVCPRKNMGQEIRNKGYDIHSTASQLQRFYENVVKGYER